MSAPDATPQSHATARPKDIPVGVVDEPPPTFQAHANLGRGIVWADILAEIAADEEERRLRGGSPPLRDAA